jgi:SAM-dependent methyltransferase
MSTDLVGLEIVEIGASLEYNNNRFFPNAKSYITTNIISGEADLVEDVTKMNFKTDSIDAIVCISVLQHVFDIHTSIDEILRVLKPGGKAIITNGYIFPVCMEEDYYRLTPAFWVKRLKQEKVKFEITELGNKYDSIENLLMRPYGKIAGFKCIVNKSIGLIFKMLRVIYKSSDNSPLGIAVVIEKNN